MQLANITSAMRYLAPPKRCFRTEDETAFQLEFIRGGYGFAVALTLLGCVMASGFMLATRLTPLAGTDIFAMQAVRLIIALTCGTCLIALLIDPERALRNSRLTIFAPALISLFGLATLFFLADLEALSDIAIGRSTVSMAIAVFLIAAFCRLPLHQIMFMTTGASLLNLIVLTWHGTPHIPYFALDLIIANIGVWCLAVQIEKRERVIWHQAARQRQATRRARRAAEKASIANRAKGRLLRSVGHDIRQPLSSGGIYLGVVSRAAQDSANEMMQENVNRVRTCLRSVEGTLERLMEIPSENDELGLETGRTDMKKLFQELRHVFDPQADQLGVELRFTQSCDSAMMARTNERAMREVLGNIIANALKYSAIVNQRSPMVMVGATCISDMIRVDIVDNGVGIPHALHTRVFDEYFRSPTVVDRVRGSGLGLAIVESTMQRLPDHRLRLQSREGQGTRVKVYMPQA